MSVVPIFFPKSIESSNQKRMFLGKLANVLSVQPKRFNPEDFKPEEPVMYSDEKGRTQVKGCDIENYVRWRYNSEGKVESNAKLVKWEDGSHTLFIGEEALEVKIQPNSNLQAYERFRDMYYFKQDVQEKIMFKPCSIKSRMHIRRLENVLNPVKTTKVVVTSENPEVEKKRREHEREQSIRVKERDYEKANVKLEASYFDGYESEESLDDEVNIKGEGSKRSGEPRKRRKYEEDSSSSED